MPTQMKKASAVMRGVAAEGEAEQPQADDEEQRHAEDQLRTRSTRLANQL